MLRSQRRVYDGVAKALVVALSFCRLLGLGCPKQAFAKYQLPDFLPLPLSELKDQAVSLSELNIKNYSDLYSRIYKANTITQKVLIIEKWLCEFFDPKNHIPHIVDEALAYLEKHNGMKKILSLTQYLDLDKRKVERLFQHQVGLSPKEYSRNIRIEKARNYIKHSDNNSLTNVAYALGYYDQSHFINQFKKVEGITPREYMMKALNKDHR